MNQGAYVSFAADIVENVLKDQALPLVQQEAGRHDYMHPEYGTAEAPKQIIKKDKEKKECLFFDFTNCFTLNWSGNDAQVGNNNNSVICLNQERNHNKYHSFHPDSTKNGVLGVTECRYDDDDDDAYDINDTPHAINTSIKNNSYWLSSEYYNNHKKGAPFSKSNILYIIGKNSFKLNTKIEIKFKLTHVDNTFIGLISLPAKKCANTNDKKISIAKKRVTVGNLFEKAKDYNYPINGLKNNGITDYTGILMDNGNLYERGKLLDEPFCTKYFESCSIITLDFDATCSPCKMRWYVDGVTCIDKDTKLQEHIVEMDINSDDTGLYPIISVGRRGNIGMISQWKMWSEEIYHHTIMKCAHKMLKYPFVCPKEIAALIVSFLEKTGIDCFERHIDAYAKMRNETVFPFF